MSHFDPKRWAGGWYEWIVQIKDSIWSIFLSKNNQKIANMIKLSIVGHHIAYLIAVHLFSVANRHFSMTAVMAADASYDPGKFDWTFLIIA